MFNLFLQKKEKDTSDKRHIAHSKTVMCKDIKKFLSTTFPKSEISPVIPKSEIFEVFLNIRNPLDLDKSIYADNTVETILDNIEEKKRISLERETEADIKKARETIKRAIENNDEEALKNWSSNFRDEKITDEWKTLSLYEVSKMTDEQLSKIS